MQRNGVEYQGSAEATKLNRLKSSDKVSAELRREYLDMDTDEEEFGHQGIYLYQPNPQSYSRLPIAYFYNRVIGADYPRRFEQTQLARNAFRYSRAA